MTTWELMTDAYPPKHHISYYRHNPYVKVTPSAISIDIINSPFQYISLFIYLFFSPFCFHQLCYFSFDFQLISIILFSSFVFYFWIGVYFSLMYFDCHRVRTIIKTRMTTIINCVWNDVIIRIANNSNESVRV